VTRDIPANCLAVGNPARVVRQFDGVSTLSGLQSIGPDEPPRLPKGFEPRA
jgi:hypothetical protein